MVSSPTDRKSRDQWDIAAIILFVIVAVTIIATFRDYGVSWDEGDSHEFGEHFLRWYKSGFTDRAVLSRAYNEYLYGGLFFGLAAYLGNNSPIDVFETTHLLIAIVGLGGIVFAYRAGKLLAGSRAGFLSAAILTLTPSYYGHSFMNQKDLPFAVAYLASLYFMVRLYDKLPRIDFKSLLLTGTAIGLAIGVRVGGVMLFGYLLGLILLWHVTARMKREAGEPPIESSSIITSAVGFTGITAVAWLLMLLAWPFAQLDPIRNPLIGLAKSAQYTDAKWTNLYDGVYLPVNALPWHYLPSWFVRTLPEFYLVALVAGIALLCVALLKGWKRLSAREDIDANAKNLFWLLVTFAPFGLVLITRPIMYDGTRLFLFVVPPLAVLCGICLSRAISVLPSTAKRAFTLLLLVLVSMTIVEMVKLHPYQYIYFNRVSGGLKGAYGKYETDYWGTSYKEGADWLIRNYAIGAAAGSVRVYNPNTPFLTLNYFRRNDARANRFIFAQNYEDPHILMSTTRWNQHIAPGRVLYIAKREGIPLLYVIELKSPGVASSAR